MALASAIGNGRKITEFTMANSAALAAMQTANVSSTVSANPLSRHKERTAYFTSRKSVSMTCAPPSLHFAENGRGKLYRRGGLAPANQYVLWKSYARAQGKVPSGYAAFEEIQRAVLDVLDGRKNSSILTVCRANSCAAEAAVPIKLPGTKSRHAGKGSRQPGRTRAFPQFRA